MRNPRLRSMETHPDWNPELAFLTVLETVYLLPKEPSAWCFIYLSESIVTVKLKLNHCLPPPRSGVWTIYCCCCCHYLYLLLIAPSLIRCVCSEPGPVPTTTTSCNFSFDPHHSPIGSEVLNLFYRWGSWDFKVSATRNRAKIQLCLAAKAWLMTT